MGLIDDDDAGIVEQCDCNAESLTHAAGERADLLLAHIQRFVRRNSDSMTSRRGPRSTRPSGLQVFEQSFGFHVRIEAEG